MLQLSIHTALHHSGWKGLRALQYFGSNASPLSRFARWMSNKTTSYVNPRLETFFKIDDPSPSQDQKVTLILKIPEADDICCLVVCFEQVAQNKEKHTYQGQASVCFLGFFVSPQIPFYLFTKTFSS